MKSKDKQVVEILFEDDLKEFLQKMGKLDDFLNGRVKCTICGSTVDFSNLGFIFIMEGNFYFICDLPECLEEALKMRGPDNELRD